MTRSERLSNGSGRNRPPSDFVDVWISVSCSTCLEQADSPINYSPSTRLALWKCPNNHANTIEELDLPIG